jgi:Zn-finger nucleic acid-binding protein
VWLDRGELDKLVERAEALYIPLERQIPEWVIERC